MPLPLGKESSSFNTAAVGSRTPTMRVMFGQARRIVAIILPSPKDGVSDTCM